MATSDATIFVAENDAYQYSCNICNYNGKKKSDYDKHILTRKHQRATNAIQKSPETNWSCNCGKNFKHSSSFYRHKKNCKKQVESEESMFYNEEETEEEMKKRDELLLKIIKENIEIKGLVCKQSDQIQQQSEQLHQQSEQLMEQNNQIEELIPKINSIQSSNINNFNNINKNFNINIFLNEKCKDAINLDEFINSIEITLEQLDFTKNKGLAEGISNVILENMNKLSLYKRPIHCTDIKRETLYVKNEDIWIKDKDQETIKKAIKKTSNKNYKTLQKWKDNNPDFLEDELQQEYFVKTISVIGKPMSTIDEKVIKNICVKTHIKSNL